MNLKHTGQLPVCLMEICNLIVTIVAFVDDEI